MKCTSNGCHLNCYNATAEDLQFLIFSYENYCKIAVCNCDKTFKNFDFPKNFEINCPYDYIY